MVPGPFCNSEHLPGRGSVQVAAVRGRSTVVRACATSPLRLLTPRNHGRGAWIYTSSFGGGLVGGDDLRLEIDVAPGATAFVSTQASTKVYRSPLGASAELTARVGAGGLLVVAPDPVVCFAASRYRQAQHIELSGTAGLVLVDWMTSGRRAAGERWAFGEYTAATRVLVEGTLAVYDRLTLRGPDGDLAERMGRFDVLAVALVMGPSLRAHAEGLVARISETPPVKRAGRLVAAASLAPRALGDVGCLVRVAAQSVEDAAGVIRQCLAFVPDLLGDDPWLRKW